MVNVSKKLSVLLIVLFLFQLNTKSQAQDLKDAIRLTKSEQFSAAGSMFKKLIAQNPASGDYYYYYGINFLERYFSDTLNTSFKEMSDSATAVFEGGVRAEPSNPLNFVGLGQVAMIRKNLQQAQSFFAKATALLPSKANKNILMAPEKQSVVLVQMAEAFTIARVRDTAQVFSLLRAAEKLDSKNPELYIVKGDVYILLLNDGSKAIMNYNYAQGLDPKSPEAKLRIGQLWMRAHNYKDALTYYQDVVKIDSTFAPAYRELGSLLARAGRQEEAQKNYKKFLALSSGNTTARKQFVNTLIDLKNYQEAINQLNEIRLVDTNDNDVNRALAYSYFETGQYEKGLQYSRKFFANANPDKIRSMDYIYYGRLLYKAKQDSLAPDKLLKAFQMDSTKTELISEAALCWAKVKKYDKARDLYEMKINLKAGIPMDYYNLGKVYYNIQDYIRADTNLAIFNNLQPDYIQGWTYRARAKSNLDPDSKMGLAKPIYETILEKTMADTVKYAKDRIESYSFLAYYNFVQYIQTKNKEFALKSIDFCNLVIAIDPNDEKANKAKQIIDNLKKFMN